ncbi:MAG: D-alanyl-D-alanine carboxypeptidase family protein [Bacillota bacterium]|nr:D-alanyl-D-alanine carboxypeptidase family protein [Bacillota bacterium]
MKKRVMAFFAAISILLSTSVYAEQMELSAQCAALLCADTGEFIYEKNADSHMLIASTTKIMTAIVVIESCDLDEEVLIDTEWCNIEGSSMYLEAGKTYTVLELLTGMMITSGNDAATALACYISGSTADFAQLMNSKAQELGLKNTSFENPHGLDGEKQYSSARDMALLTAYCMENEVFRDIVARKTADIGELTFVNHNKLLWNCEGCIGVKTGYTIAAGRTLVSCCERNGMRLICVTLNAPDDWNDHMKLYDWAFSAYKLAAFRKESFKIQIPTVSGINKFAVVSIENDTVFLTGSSTEVSIELELPRFLFAGGLQGEKIGVIRVYLNGELASEENLVYTVDDTIDMANKASIAERMFGSKPYYISGK